MNHFTLLLFFVGSVFCQNSFNVNPRQSQILRTGKSEPIFQDIRAAAFDSTSGLSYWASHSIPSILYEVNPDNFRVLRQLILPIDLATSLYLDQKNGDIFLGFDTSPTGEIAKINIKKWEITARVKTFHNAHALAFDADHHILYVATKPPNAGLGSAIHKINATNLVVLDSLELPVEDGRLETLQLDNSRHYLYAGNDGSPASVYRIWAEPALRRMDVLSFPIGWDRTSVSLIEPDFQHVYFGIVEPVGRIVKIELSTFTWVDTISTGTKGPSSAVYDVHRGFSFWTSSEIPSQIHRVRMCDFQLLDSESFYTDDRLPRAVALNPLVGRLAYGTSCFGDVPCPQPCNYLISFDVTGDGACEKGGFSRGYIGDDTHTFNTVVNLKLGGMFPRGASCCPQENAFFPGQPNAWRPAISHPPQEQNSH